MNIEDIPIDNDINHDINIKSIYQAQCEENKYCIVHVGNMNECSDVLIKKFKVKHFQCNLVSCLFSEEELKVHKSEIPLIRLDYYDLKKNIHIGSITCNINIFEHIRNNESILNYISNKENKKIMNGFFSIKHITKNKEEYLFKQKEAPNKDDMIIKCMEYLYKVIC